MLRHWSPAISLLSLNECEAACPWALVLSDDSAPLSSYCNDRLSGFVCDSIWFLAGVTPALLQLTKESLCSYSPMIPFQKLLSQILSNVPSLSQDRESPVGSFHNTPHQTTPHGTMQACRPRLALCPAMLPAPLIGAVAFIAVPSPRGAEQRVGKGTVTPTFIFLNASMVLVERGAQNKHWLPLSITSFLILPLQFPCRRQVGKTFPSFVWLNRTLLWIMSSCFPEWHPPSMEE